MFKQQLIGTVNLALPSIILFQVYPDFVFSGPGMIVMSLVTGLYVLFVNWKTSKNMIASFLYTPTADHAQEFSALITECGMSPDAVTINYAYTNEGIAMATFNNIVIDPVLCSSVEHDPHARKVNDIYAAAIEPQLSVLQKTRLCLMQQALTPAAQRFIFKHELGHVFYNFSYWRLLLGYVSAWWQIYV